MWEAIKSKKIAKPITPLSESDSEEVSNPEQAYRDKDMQKKLALIAKYFKKIYKPTNNSLRTSSNSRNKNVDTTPRYKNDNQYGQFWSQRMVNVSGARDNVGSLVVQQSGIQCFNCKEFGHFAKDCIKPKRVKDSAYHKEKMLLCKQAEKDLKAQLQDKNIAISELKKLIEKCKEKSVETKFGKPSVVRQTNAQRIPKSSVLGKSAPFLDSLERKIFSQPKSIPKTDVSDSLSKPVTTQILHQTTKQAVSNIKVIKSGMYRIDSKITQTRAPQLPQTSRNTNPPLSTFTGVTHKTNVSIPQHRSNQIKEKVVPNNSQVKLKKTELEDHPRILSISNKTKSVTACNDSLKSKTSNDDAVCATCSKCLIDSNHFACVTKMLNDMNARTKKPNVVPISTRKSKGHANKSIATPSMKKLHRKQLLRNPRVTIGCCMRKLVIHRNGG
nr:hypothetical protein [Tanacetum cinerariifolium]